MKKLVIVGSGEFAREVKWLVERINHVENTWDFAGFIDNDVSNLGVIGNDEYMLSAKEELYAVVAIGSPGIRKRIVEKYKYNPNIIFANLIDPSVIMSDSIDLGEGNIVCAGNILTVDISIGNHNIINLNCTVGHDTVIGDYVTINPGVNVSGKVTVNSNTFIGTGAKIIQGLNIGENVVLGAGAVATKNIPAWTTAVGVPAEVIKNNRE